MISKLKLKNRQEILNIYDRYHSINFLKNDPLVIPHEYMGHDDLELIAWLGALFSLGKVAQIQKSLREVISRFHRDGDSFSNMFRNTENVFQFASMKLDGFKHRFYIGDDVATLIYLYSSLKREFGSFQNWFENGHSIQNTSIEQALNVAIHDLKNRVQIAKNNNAVMTGRFFNHFLTAPSDGGVCKRWVMFLKWMVRKDDLDLGIWSKGQIHRRQLVIPMDVHVSRLAKKFGLVDRQGLTWKTAIQATQSLASIDPQDPTRFDFSLCRYGMFEGSQS